MPDAVTACLLCRPDDADREFSRVEVWRDGLWRLTVSLIAPVPGFGYLEPLRHIPHITDLDGPEAAGFGPTLARVTTTLQRATGSELVYATVFGERHAHLHVNLAPHRTGDALTGGPGLLRPDAEPVPVAHLQAVAERVRGLLA